MSLRFAATALALLGLCACAEPFAQDFTLTTGGDAALGFAEPDEFSDAEILTALRTLCADGGVTNYTSELANTGTKFFGARCDAGFTVERGTIYVTRTSTGELAFDLPS